MTYEQIGEVEGISFSMAKRICDQALLKLRRRHPRELEIMLRMAAELEQNSLGEGVVRLPNA